MKLAPIALAAFTLSAVPALADTQLETLAIDAIVLRNFCPLHGVNIGMNAARVDYFVGLALLEGGTLRYFDERILLYAKARQLVELFQLATQAELNPKPFCQTIAVQFR